MLGNYNRLSPAFITRLVPFICWVAFTKNKTDPVTSSIVSKFFNGWVFFICSMILSSVSAVRFVSMNEGDMQLDVILKLIFSIAQDLLIESKYDLLAA